MALLTCIPPEELQHFIWNCDETGFCIVQVCQKINKAVQDNHALVGVAELDLLVEYVYLHTLSTKARTFGVDGCMTGGPAESLYSVSESRWMEDANFQQWVEKLFLPAVKHLTTKNPVLLIFDGHHSHISLELIELAQKNNIHLLYFSLPPPPTHTHTHTHYTPASAPECWSLWATEAGMDEDSQGASDQDMCWHSNNGGLPRSHCLGSE